MADRVRALADTLLESALIVALYDAEDRLILVNDAYERRFLRGLKLPIPFGDVLRHGFRNGFGVKIDCGDVEIFLADTLVRRRSVPYRAFEVDTCDGEWLWMTETVCARDGYLLSVASDITTLKSHERVLRQEKQLALEAAQKDALTGIANRGHVMSLAEHLLARSLQEERSLTAVLIDIDHFKSINDTHGHDVGDAVLRAFAQLLETHLRDGDVVGRVGGEEFLILLPGTSAALADQIVERLRVSSRPQIETLHRCTFSAGITEALPTDTVATFYKRADVALYEAKARGRNCNVVSTPVGSRIGE